MYNKKVLIDSIKKLGSATSPPKKKDMIIDPRGQWAHPGQNTRIPSNNITMDAVPYPVYGDPNVGPSRMMYPEQEYNFPGADYVDEYPQINSKPLLKNQYGGALPKFQDKGAVKLLSKGYDLLSKVTRSNYNPLVIPIKKIGYTIASQSAGFDRSKQDILNALKGKSKSAYFGTILGLNEKGISTYGPGKRDLNKLYFFGDETGFLPVNYDFSSDPGLDKLVEKYGPLKAFLLNSKVGHGEPISAFQLNTADILAGIGGGKGFYEPLLNFKIPMIQGWGPEATPQFYLPDGSLNLDLLSKGDIRHADPKKIMETINHPELQTHVGYLKDFARARFNTLFDEVGTDVIPFQINAAATARPEFMLESNPVRPLDNVAGHMGFAKRLPNKEFEFTTRDIWGFTPSYDEKWSMNTAFQKAQRKAMEMFGKPFVLTQTNPIKFRKGGDSTNNDLSVKQSNIEGADKGLFSEEGFRKDQLIGLAHKDGQPVGKIGNMHNHSDEPNMYSIKKGNQRYVYAKRDIQPGEELTTDYRQQPELEQPEDFMRKGGSISQAEYGGLHKFVNGGGDDGSFGAAYKKASYGSTFWWNGKQYKKDLEKDNEAGRQSIINQNPTFWENIKKEVNDNNKSYYGDDGKQLYSGKELEALNKRSLNDILDHHLKSGNPNIVLNNSLGADGNPSRAFFRPETNTMFPKGLDDNNKQQSDLLMRDYIEELLHARQLNDKGKERFDEHVREDYARHNIYWDGNEWVNYKENFDSQMYDDPLSIEGVHYLQAPGLESRLRRNFDVEEKDDTQNKNERLWDITPYITGEKTFGPYENQGDLRKLQKVLDEYGYALPNSRKKDGTFDGIYGDETKKAFEQYKKDYQQGQLKPTIREEEDIVPTIYKDKNIESYYKTKNQAPEKVSKIDKTKSTLFNLGARSWNSMKEGGGLHKFVGGGASGCPKGEYWNGTKCVKIPKNTRIVYHTDKDVYDKAFAAESDSSHFYNNAKSDYNKVRTLQSRIRTSVGDAAQDKARDAYNKERDRQEKKWYTDNYEPGTTINHKYKGPKSNLKIKPVGLTKDSIDGYGFPVFKKPVVHNVYEEPIEEEFIPMPIKKPELIDTTTGDIIGQSEQLLAPEYSARYPENRIGYKKYNWNTTKSGLPKRQPNTGGFYKKANKKVEDIQNYMEGYEDEDGNYIPGEIEKAEQEGRQIKFKGNISKTDKKAQETYNKEYDEYENLKNYQNGMMNLMQYNLNKKQYGGLNKFVDGGQPCPEGYEWVEAIGDCFKINPDANDILYPQTKTPVSAEYAAENPNVMPYVLNLPEAQAVLPDWMADNKKFGKDNINWYQAWNPRKWGLNDYSEYSSYNSAFRNARASKEKEFVYKGERYNTDLIPKKESDLYWESKNFLKDYYQNEPYKFNGGFDSDTPREYLIKESYVKNKYGTTFVDLYEKIQATDPNDPKYVEMNQLLDKILIDEFSMINKTNKDYANYQNSILTKAKQKAIDKRLGSLDKPSYFSITNQKPKSMSEDGYWKEKDNKTFMYTESMPGKLNTTYVHELSHKGDDFLDVLNTVPQIDMEKFNKSPYIKTWDQKHFDYVSDPSEIEARKLSTLFYLFKNKKPYKSGKITQEILDDLYSNSEKLPYDIKQLLDLYGVQQEDLLKYLNSNYEYKKKKGGFLNKKQYGGGLHKFVEGDKPDNGIITQEEIDAANTAMMKARLAYANEFGNPAAKRMINLPDEPYQFDNGDMGTHYMASMDNYAVPQIQDENGQLMLGDYGPDSREAMRFDSDEDANYFAENYKDVSPGFMELELSPEEIEEYAKGGYIVEDISVPSLNRKQLGGLIKSGKNLLRGANIATLGTANTLAKNLAPVMINPARIPMFGAQIDKVGPFTGSPLNVLPGYGKKMESTPGTAFRKFGDTLDYVKMSGELNPAHGPLLRMGKDQVMSEGNWAELNEPNEQYSGVFGAQFDTRVPGSDLSFKTIPKRNGVLVTDASGNLKPIIPISDPGLSFHRRLPFSNRYIPVDMNKLRNDQFDWRTVGGNAQSLLERYGYAAGYAGLLGAMGLATPQEYIDQYINEPIMKGYNKYIKPGVENMQDVIRPKRYGLKEDGSYEEYSKGGYIVEEIEDGGDPDPLDPHQSFLKNWYENRVFPKEMQKAKPMLLNQLEQPFPPYVPTDALPTNVAAAYNYDDNIVELNKNYSAELQESSKTHENNHYLTQDANEYLDKPHTNLIEQNIINPKDINTGNKEWDKAYKENFDEIVSPEEMHSRIMTLRELAGFKPDQVITEQDVEDYFESVGDKLDPDIQDIKQVTKGNKAIVELLNYMASNNSNEDLNVAKYGGTTDYELGEEIDEATMKKLKKLGYTFETI
jgi:hypothetical protein